jgi:mRNA interferase HigB
MNLSPRVFFRDEIFWSMRHRGIRLTNALVPIWDYASFINMRIIALSTLKAFLNRSHAYADARDPVTAWYRQVKAADWASPAEVKQAIRTASILKDGRVVFNIAGNKYRIVVWINYPHRVVYIRFIGTHRQYDTINAQTI